MKKIIFVLAIMMVATTYTEGHSIYNGHVTISFQTFYDQLSPYGEWISTSDYGYVWRPYIDPSEGFMPYSSRGNWAFTNLGWTWVSDYDWGWATFHYGRWYYDDFLGWMWIPGYEWAPAWVTWGSYNNYWGWAPMGPFIQVGYQFAWHAPAFWWTFVPNRHFCSNYWRSYAYNQPIQINNITYITNIYNYNNTTGHNHNWFYGPRVIEVEKHLNRRVERRQIVDTDNPRNARASKNRIAVYRPEVLNTRTDKRPGKFQVAENLRSDVRSRNTESVRTNENTRNTGNSSVNRSTRTIRTETVTSEIRTRNTGNQRSESVYQNDTRKSNVVNTRTDPANIGVKSQGQVERHGNTSSVMQSGRTVNSAGTTIRPAGGSHSGSMKKTQDTPARQSAGQSNTVPGNRSGAKEVRSTPSFPLATRSR